ncbi:hypothetical protein EW146_g1053 [Bondarzewia mesenterica]|uniref:Glycosyltransferase family 8 protein n=1 Tax=Bondarzewia mesenterica TaxID=1095465 RepID=A0A4S4M7A1_9AGAM|nr:hypothetical protein EW146_g1053 [Bondarzewia mesenterica]
MTDSRADYIPLFSGTPPAYSKGRPRWLWILCAVLGVLNIALSAKLFFRSKPAANALDDYQILKPMFVTGRQELIPSSPPDLSSRAVVSSLYTDSFAMPVATLGHSLTTSNTTARKILMYLPAQVSPHALCIVRAAGWELHPITRISPPHNGAGLGDRFEDQYSKLNLWGLDRLGIRSAVYLDADTLIRKPFEELFALPFEFAAVPDVWKDDKHGGFKLGFNAGVLVLRPNNETLTNMIGSLERARFPPLEAEQAFLNLYYGGEALRLPYVYNANLAIKQRNPTLWRAMVEDIRIMHYTSVKPFDFLGKEVGTLERMKEVLEGRKNDEGGLFREELGWWEEVWKEVISKPDVLECLADGES